MHATTAIVYKRKRSSYRKQLAAATAAIFLCLVYLAWWVGIAPTQVSAAETGSVRITEFMADPTAVADTNGEWIEIQNVSDAPISIANWDINGSTISGNVTLAGGKRVVICKNSNAAANGGVICNATSGFSLAQTGSETRTINLRDETNTVVHAVSYVGSGDVAAGRSTHVKNDQLSQEMTYRYNAVDFGTPANNTAHNQDLAFIRMHATTDLNKNGRMDMNGEPGIHEPGWTMRLYDSDWQSANYGDDDSNEIVTTSLPYQSSAIFRVLPGDYFVCQVGQAGHTQSFVATITSWVTWDDNGVANESGSTDEGDTCIAVTGLTAGKNTSHKFGNIVEDAPTMGQLMIAKIYDIDADGEPDWNDDEKHQAGWTMRLYDEQWNYVDSVVTNNQPYFAASFTVAPGQYYICEVMQAGYAQSFARTITSWVTWPESGTANQSAQADEGEQCIDVTVLPNGFSSHVFGNTPVESSQNSAHHESQTQSVTVPSPQASINTQEKGSTKSTVSQSASTTSADNESLPVPPKAPNDTPPVTEIENTPVPNEPIDTQ